ncbi:hypothetical protein [Accumulibacter sp.]|uniref:hypothetical protein n=1 Tax=Accumulibacter sp. TaxID=2053492 RepID=UPI0025D71E77|nr:hypothetical protein [Accumulibacter sp.]MCM8596996.1 hypothetical protein [Accumulibacter sp.]MCM8626258.1 hypothetical protein [Accumulibacter sp.]MDS4051145.1 hypothetical protein [Accumulibacter sp.]
MSLQSHATHQPAPDSVTVADAQRMFSETRVLIYHGFSFTLHSFRLHVGKGSAFRRSAMSMALVSVPASGTSKATRIA